MTNSGDNMPVDADFMRRLAAAAAAETLPRFRQNAAVANKEATRFDPVTEADREAERAIRAMLRERFPGHGLLGEEWGGENLENRHVWVIDPIDGTRAFISGLPVWGTLIGLLEDGDAIAGLMAQLFTGELFLAVNGQATYDGPGGPSALRTRRTARLTEATLCTTSPALYGTARAAYDRLEGAVRMARYGTDCYAFAMLAAGHVDLVAEAGLQPYDIVALIPLIEAAGGVVTDWSGGPAEKGGMILASATPELHEAALALVAEG